MNPTSSLLHMLYYSYGTITRLFYTQILSY